MGRLEDNPEYKYAAKLAKVGPETWDSWIGALAAVATGFRELTKDSPMGSTLRLLGVGVPRTQYTPEEQLKQLVLDYGVPGGSNVGGVVKGLKAAIRKGKPGAQIRQHMAQEHKARGKVAIDQTTSKPETLGSILRGTAYHAGRYERFPQLGEMFNPANFKVGNIGEPMGMSVTYNPTVLFGEKGAFVKRPEKWARAETKLDTVAYDIYNKIDELTEKYYNAVTGVDKSTISAELKKLRALDRSISDRKQKALSADAKRWPFARVMPRFYGRPEDVILKGWKNGGDDELFKEAYVYALQQMPELWAITSGYNKANLLQLHPDLTPSQAATFTNTMVLLTTDASLRKALIRVLHNIETKSTNTTISDWDVIYQRMPKSIVGPLEHHLEAIRKGEGPEWIYQGAINDLNKMVSMYLSDEAKGVVPTTKATIPNYSYIRSVLDKSSGNRAKFNTHITQYLQSKGKHGVLYLPQRYEEYELKMFDPRDVLMLDLRKATSPEIERTTGATYQEGMYGKSGELSTRPARRTPLIKEWAAERGKAGLGESHSDTSLGKIYADIDLPSLTLPPPDQIRAQAEQVKLGALAQAVESKHQGLRMGQEGRYRGRARAEDQIPDFDYSKPAPTGMDKDIKNSLDTFFSEPGVVFEKSGDKIQKFNMDTGEYLGSYTHPNLKLLPPGEIWVDQEVLPVKDAFGSIYIETTDGIQLQSLDDLASFLTTGQAPGGMASTMMGIDDVDIKSMKEKISDLKKKSSLFAENWTKFAPENQGPQLPETLYSEDGDWVLKPNGMLFSTLNGEYITDPNEVYKVLSKHGWQETTSTDTINFDTEFGLVKSPSVQTTKTPEWLELEKKLHKALTGKLPDEPTITVKPKPPKTKIPLGDEDLISILGKD